MELVNEQQLISEAMRLLGKRTSKRKAKSSAANAEKARQARAKKFPKKKVALTYPVVLPNG